MLVCHCRMNRVYTSTRRSTGIDLQSKRRVTSVMFETAALLVRYRCAKWPVVGLRLEMRLVLRTLLDLACLIWLYQTLDSLSLKGFFLPLVE